MRRPVQGDVRASIAHVRVAQAYMRRRFILCVVARGASGAGGAGGAGGRCKRGGAEIASAIVDCGARAYPEETDKLIKVHVLQFAGVVFDLDPVLEALLELLGPARHPLVRNICFDRRGVPVGERVLRALAKPAVVVSSGGRAPAGSGLRRVRTISGSGAPRPLACRTELGVASSVCLVRLVPNFCRSFR